jgi:hypothetical protein
MNKIFCFGDGYAHGHIWPEWPQLLQALFPEMEVCIASGVGSGNEFLVKQLLDFGDAVKNQLVIFQWAAAKRFDKVVQDDEWLKICKKDEVYHFNLYNDLDDTTWWLSSASTNADIKLYHDFYIQEKQANIRTDMYKKLVKGYLHNLNCQIIFTSTRQQLKFSQDTRFANTRGDEVQPSPIVHLDFIIEELIPQTNLVPKKTIFEYVNRTIRSTTWKAYDEDRVEQFNNMVAQSQKLLQDSTKYT